MHELSLVMNIVEICETQALKEGFSRIERIVLDVGTLSGVSVPALRFSFEAAVPGTVLESAELEILEIQGSGWCVHCEKTVALKNLLCSCPFCESGGVLPTGGMEFRIRELIVLDHQDKGGP
jgi:hydrogenase nickel incorporation protein HypA/HybF